MCERPSCEECSQHTLQLSEVLLLSIESSTSRGLIAEVVESEPIDDINHLLSRILDSLFCLFLRRVGADIYIYQTERNHRQLLKFSGRQSPEAGRQGRKLTDVVDTPGNPLAIDLIDCIVNLLEFVRVGDDLVVSDNVLEENVVSLCALACWWILKKFGEKAWKAGGSRARAAHLVDNHGGVRSMNGGG